MVALPAETILLVDIGSTFTKVVALDRAREALLGVASAPTTVESDVNIGLREAVQRLERRLEVSLRGSYTRVCSSAAGGLRMVAVGLVPSLTTQAARFACLGAGAKLVKSYSYELSPVEIAEINGLGPDVLLLVGGTDGGEGRTVLHNARLLARGLSIPPAVIVATNKVVAPEAQDILQGKPALEVSITENVMPELNQLNLDPARRAIREVFLRRITRAKGIDRLRDGDFQVDILMPTPEAVLQAAELLSQGTPQEPGLGELIVLDIGGATTDVHSIGHGTSGTRLQKGLPEPFAKRTVEGDLGLRSNALTLVAAASEEKITQYLPPGVEVSAPEVRGYAAQVSRLVSHVPQGAEDASLDAALAVAAGGLALERHAGRVEKVLTPRGVFEIQYGKDLTNFGTLIGTGGIFAYGKHANIVLTGLCQWSSQAAALTPQAPRLLIDRDYLLFAGGLLRGIADDLAVRLMKQSLREVAITLPPQEYLP